MSSRILVYQEPREAPADILAGLLAPSYRRTPNRVGPPGIAIVVEYFEGGFGFWTYWLSPTKTRSLFDALVEEYDEVHMVRIDVIPGRRGKAIDALEAIYRNGSLVERDVSRDAEELAEDWLDGRRVDDILEDELGHALLEAFPEPHRTLDSEDLYFELTVSKRVAPLVQALEEGATWQEVELYGQTAIKVTREGESQISVLKPEELEELEPWLKDSS